MDLNASRFMELSEDFRNCLLEEGFYLSILVALDLIEVGIFQDSSKEETPSNPLYTILSVADFSSRYFCIDVIRNLC